MSCFNGALSASQVLNEALSASHTRSINVTCEKKNESSHSCVGLMGLCLLEF